MKPRHRLASLAGELRNNATDVERLLWRHLRNSQVEGVKFRRQQAIEDYIVDFVSFAPKLVVELDGGQHALGRERDRRRDECLRKNGFAVLRFWNNEVIENIGGVLEVIRRQCLGEVSPGCPLPHPPAPSREGRGSKTSRAVLEPAHSHRGRGSETPKQSFRDEINAAPSSKGRGSETPGGAGAGGPSPLNGDGRTNSPSPRGITSDLNAVFWRSSRMDSCSIRGRGDGGNLP